MTYLLAAFWRGWFGPTPRVGAVYELDEWESRNPFRESPKVEVLEVKDNWVRYRHVRDPLNVHQDESMPCDRFRFCYRVPK